MKHRVIARTVLLLSVLLSTSRCPAEKYIYGKYETWLTPSPELQLYIEGLDDRKGVGRIFVPAMTSGADEPLYAVFQDGELIGEENTGSSFFLKPGSYTVVLGTGVMDQRIRQDVVVGREQTVIIQPEWGAVTFEVIDELRTYQKQDLQIFRVESAESYGIIPAINPELGEHLQTLLLSPGLYKIVSRGRDFNTYINFTTLLLEPGRYTPYTIVIDSKTGNFIGAGILRSSERMRQRRNWNMFGAVHGNVNLTSENDEFSKKVKTNISLLGQLDTRLLYEKLPHYYLAKNLLELGAQRQEGAGWQINQDRLSLKNTYVYYILNWLGGYGRFEATTHLFEKSVRFDDPVDVLMLDEAGDTLRVRKGVKTVRVEPVFYPLDLKEGLGVNVTPLRTFKARLSLRCGLGYWQTYNRDDCFGVTDVNTVFQRKGDSFLKGLETALVSNLVLLNNLSMTTEVDVLLSFEGKLEMKKLELENFISLIIFKNVTLEHTLRLTRDPNVDHTLQYHFLSVRLSYYLF